MKNFEDHLLGNKSIFFFFSPLSNYEETSVQSYVSYPNDVNLAIRFYKFST